MIVSDAVAVAAGATSANVLANNPAESILMTPRQISLRANHAGAARTDIRTFYSRGITPLTGMDGSPTNVAAVAGQLDPRTDTLLSRTVVVGPQSLRFRNTTAAPIVVQFEYELHE